MKHVFIINPTSGIGRYKEVLDWIEENMDPAQYEFEMYVTQYVGHATEIASKYSKDTILYSVGGDGTAYEIINGMNFECEMCVIPVGTGNDFFKNLFFTKGIRTLLEDTVNEGHVERVDIGQVNDRLFLNTGNIGVDADINVDADALKSSRVPRLLIYIFSAVKGIFSMKPYKLEYFNHDFREEKEVTMLSVMNGKWYGGGFMPSPKALINDGLFDICLVDAIGRVRALTMLPKYMKGKHAGYKFIHFMKVESLEIKSDKVMNCGCDGEIFRSDHLVYSMHKGRLKYRMPKGVFLEKGI